MLTDNITTRIEYRYTDYGEEAFGIDFFPDGELKFDPATHTGMIGIAWLFNAI
jgi:opacity protein-like surface antigen